MAISVLSKNNPRTGKTRLPGRDCNCKINFAQEANRGAFLKEISQAGENLALISAPYMHNDLVQGSLGVLGPTRMPYERAMTAVAYVAQLFSEALSKI